MYVGLHSLHKISKYKGKDGVPPVVNKLGGDAWNKLKQKTKSRVKDIARELIALYARRKKEAAFAFSKDSYLQEEMEVSFMYDETPDQIKADRSGEADMEKPQVMDRLICGDVGLGRLKLQSGPLLRLWPIANRWLSWCRRLFWLISITILFPGGWKACLVGWNISAG